MEVGFITLDKLSQTQVVIKGSEEEADALLAGRFAIKCYNDPKYTALFNMALNSQLELNKLFTECAKGENFYEQFSVKVEGGQEVDTRRITNCLIIFKDVITGFFRTDVLKETATEQTTSLAGGGSKEEENCENQYRDLGVGAAVRYFNNQSSADLPRLVSEAVAAIDETAKLIIDFEEKKNKATGEISYDEKIRNFKEGYLSIIAQIQEQIREAESAKQNVTGTSQKPLEDTTEDSTKINVALGVHYAVEYYQDFSNNEELFKAFNNNDILVDIFSVYTTKNKLHLQFCYKAGDLSILNTYKYTQCLKGFIYEMKRFFNERELNFRAQNMDVDDLVRDIKGANQADPAALTQEKKKKKKKKTPHTPVVKAETPPQVSKPPKASKPLEKVVQTVPSKRSKEEKRNQNAEKSIQDFEKRISDGLLDDLAGSIKDQEDKVKRMEDFHAELEDPEKIAASMGGLAVAQRILSRYKEAFAKIPAISPEVDASTVDASAVSPPIAITPQQIEEPISITPAITPEVDASTGGASAVSPPIAITPQQIVAPISITPAITPEVEESTGGASVVSPPIPITPQQIVAPIPITPAIPPQQTIETKEFPTGVKWALMQLGLVNSHYQPLDFSGKYTEEQMQTVKICILFMINVGSFYWTVDSVRIQVVVQQLFLDLPDNEHTPKYLYGNLCLGRLDPVSVLVGTGITF